jgi:diguanylate cyclase (GGDEF)-like protein
MHFDTRAAILFSTSLTLAVLAIAVLSMRREAGKSIPGLTSFALANFLGMAAAALFGLRGIIFLSISGILGNFVLLMSAALHIDAIRRFDGHPLPDRALPACALFLFSAIAFSYSPDDMSLLITLSQGIFSCLALYCGSLLVHHSKTPSFNRFFCASGFFIVAMTSVWRAVLVQVDPSTIFFSNTPSTTYLFIFLSLGEAIFGLGFIMMIHERIAKRLSHMATHDPLTGARTRGYFMEAARSTLDGARDRRRPVSLLMADLDHFKNINDSHGHQAGDRALCHFVRSAQAALRDGDFLARYGGEEFIALLPDTSFAEAIAIAERVRHNTQAAASHMDAAHPCVTVSIGVATTELCSFDIDLLIGAADRALYASKAKGRNCVTLASPQALARSR